MPLAVARVCGIYAGSEVVLRCLRSMAFYIVRIPICFTAIIGASCDLNFGFLSASYMCGDLLKFACSFVPHTVVILRCTLCYDRGTVLIVVRIPLLNSASFHSCC